MPSIKPRDITFLDLRDSVLCSECELISYNNTAQCLACGSRAVLSLSRLLGGTLRGEPRVRLVPEQSQAKVIEAGAPHPAGFGRYGSVPETVSAAASAPLLPAFGKAAYFPVCMPAAEAAGCTPLHSAMKLVVERGYRLSRSGGAAIAARRNDRLVCQARMGASAPALGAEVGAGIAGTSVRTGRTLRCDLAADDARVDAASCRTLGVHSIVAAPIANLDRVLGVVTVLSPQPYAFDDRDVAVIQWLAGMMAVAFTGAVCPSFTAQSATRGELLGQA